MSSNNNNQQPAVPTPAPQPTSPPSTSQPAPQPTSPPSTPQPTQQPMPLPAPRVNTQLIGTERRSVEGGEISHKVIEPPEKK